MGHFFNSVVVFVLVVPFLVVLLFYLNISLINTNHVSRILPLFLNKGEITQSAHQNITQIIKEVDSNIFDYAKVMHTSTNNDCREDLATWQTKLKEQARKALIDGKKVEGNPNFLVIGIPTVYRSENYLGRTLLSLIKESDEEERHDVVVVIYLADNPENNAKQLAFIRKNYQPQLKSGFFQVIVSSPEIYPPMDFAETGRTFNDSKERVLWRAKQVIDFAFLLTYSQSLANYYLVMEDDVISAPQYLTAIRDYVDAKKGRRWVALEFTQFPCIGLLFNTKDLPKLTELLFMFYQNQPVDMLMRKFITLEAPDANLTRKRIPSLFQHIGKRSSLQNKVQNVYDSSFGFASRRFRSNRNPKANLVTTMNVYDDFFPVNAYKSAPGYFRGMSKQNDSFDIIFPAPIRISRIIVLSGNYKRFNKTDFIVSGSLETSRVFLGMSSNNSSAMCDNFKEVATFKKGDVDYHFPSDQENEVQCIRVLNGSGQNSWVVIREIQIFR